MTNQLYLKTKASSLELLSRLCLYSRLTRYLLLFVSQISSCHIIAETSDLIHCSVCSQCSHKLWLLSSNSLYFISRLQRFVITYTHARSSHDYVKIRAFLEVEDHSADLRLCVNNGIELFYAITSYFAKLSSVSIRSYLRLQPHRNLFIPDGACR